MRFCHNLHHFLCPHSSVYIRILFVDGAVHIRVNSATLLAHSTRFTTFTGTVAESVSIPMLKAGSMCWNEMVFRQQVQPSGLLAHGDRLEQCLKRGVVGSQLEWITEEIMPKLLQTKYNSQKFFTSGAVGTLRVIKSFAGVCNYHDLSILLLL